MAKFPRKVLSKLCFKQIAISSIVTELKSVSRQEGWGGKHIRFFPPYKFYLLYISGKQQKAKNNMSEWYINRFVNKKLCITPKSKGGMLAGSLFKAVADIHAAEGINLKKDLSNSDSNLLIKGINAKVDERFRLLESILKTGYNELIDYIYVKRTGGFYIILNGHHRLAAVAACGVSTVLCGTKRNLLLRFLTKVRKASRHSYKSMQIL